MPVTNSPPWAKCIKNDATSLMNFFGPIALDMLAPFTVMIGSPVQIRSTLGVMQEHVGGNAAQADCALETSVAGEPIRFAAYFKLEAASKIGISL